LFLLNMNSRIYCAGMAMATPFAAATLPYPWLLLSLMVSIPFVIHLVRYGIRLPKAGDIPAVVWPVLLLGLFHFCGLWRGQTPFGVRVLVDTGIVAAAVVVFLLGHTEGDAPEEMLRGFFSALVPFTVVIAVIGLIKAALLEGGYLLGFLHALYPDHYPPGTSLRGDYNLFSLSMLIGGLGLVSRIVNENARSRNLALGYFTLALVLTAGILAGSRRFLLISLLIPALWFTAGILVFPKRLLVERVILPMAVVACAVGLLAGNWLVNVPAPLHKYKVLYLFPGSMENAVQKRPSEKMSPAAEERAAAPEGIYKDQDKQTVGRTDLSSEREVAAKQTLRTEQRRVEKGVEPVAEAEKTGTVMPVHPAEMLGTLQRDQVYGLDSRVDRWQLALDLLAQGAWLGGMGFAYHEVFSCRFAACSFLDYPHFPILSEWLIGGVAGAVVAVAIYFLLFRSIWRSGRVGLTSGSSAIALAVVPYSLLSGDTLFSIPQFIIVCLLAQIHPASGKNAVRDAVAR